MTVVDKRRRDGRMRTDNLRTCYFREEVDLRIRKRPANILQHDGGKHNVTHRTQLDDKDASDASSKDRLSTCQIHLFFLKKRSIPTATAIIPRVVARTPCSHCEMGR